ncbi:MAG TPA: CbiM family transporter [Gemmataceae bacterium]|nr:CbiM family transporter [Gemmataceae bacterium]
MPLVAVHISDGVLSPLYLAVGFAAMALLMIPAVWRIDEEEVPRIGLLTAAFFVASLIHVRVGVTSVHLLLNGLIGVVVGTRAALAIAVGLGLQALLLGHGGFTTLGVNTSVMTLPAFTARWTFWLVSGSHRPIRPRRAFGAGLVSGTLAVILTAALNAAVLVVAGVEDFRVVAALVFVAHLPIAAIEGLVVGFTASYLARVKPDLLDRPKKARAAEDQESAAGPESADVVTSSQSRTGS